MIVQGYLRQLQKQFKFETLDLSFIHQIVLQFHQGFNFTHFVFFFLAFGIIIIFFRKFAILPKITQKNKKTHTVSDTHTINQKKAFDFHTINKQLNILTVMAMTLNILQSLTMYLYCDMAVAKVQALQFAMENMNLMYHKCQ